MLDSCSGRCCHQGSTVSYHIPFNTWSCGFQLIFVALVTVPALCIICRFEIKDLAIPSQVFDFISTHYQGARTPPVHQSQANKTLVGTYIILCIKPVPKDRWFSAYFIVNCIVGLVKINVRQINIFILMSFSIGLKVNWIIIFLKH